MSNWTKSDVYSVIVIVLVGALGIQGALLSRANQKIDYLELLYSEDLLSGEELVTTENNHYYHNQFCDNANTTTDEIFYSEQSAQEAGYAPCPVCIPLKRKETANNYLDARDQARADASQ